VRVENDSLDLVIRWAGDDHTALRVRKNRTGRHRWSAEADVVDLVQALARQMPDPAIAAVLNRAGMSTGKGNSWTRSRVASLRGHNEIAVYREGERAERGEATLDEAAEALSVSPATVRRLIADSVLPASQHCRGAPYVIRTADLQRSEVVNEATRRRKRSPPRPPSEDQQTLHMDFQ
jgi:excisionase family DNA binding protein